MTTETQSSDLRAHMTPPQQAAWTGYLAAVAGGRFNDLGNVPALDAATQEVLRLIPVAMWRELVKVERDFWDARYKEAQLEKAEGHS